MPREKAGSSKSDRERSLEGRRDRARMLKLDT